MYDEVYDYVEDKVGLATDSFFTGRGALAREAEMQADNRQKVLMQLGKAEIGPRSRMATDREKD